MIVAFFYSILTCRLFANIIEGKCCNLNYCRGLEKKPKDEVSLNAQLLIRAGFIDKLMAGVYYHFAAGVQGDEKNRKHRPKRNGGPADRNF